MPHGIDFTKYPNMSANGQYLMVGLKRGKQLFEFDGHQFINISPSHELPQYNMGFVDNQGQVYEEDTYRLYSHIPEKKLLINIRPVFEGRIRFRRSIIINEQSLLLPLTNKNMIHDK
ncbi:MAG: hypothetical protein GY787_21795 [Alteromonadales bacterium]|nr:hypothetical protein [Alteromonadales bacterium]